MRGPASDDLANAKRLEVGLIGLRWLTVAFAVLQSIASAANPDRGPDHVLPVGMVLVAILAIGNVVISITTEGASRPDRLRRLGVVAFVFDIALVTALVWTYARPGNSLWVIAYVLPLEGAVRFGLAGALVAVAVTAVSEPLREVWLAARLDGTAQGAAVVFRVGVDLVVAVVAGVMARSMRREAQLARDRAVLAEGSAERAEAAARSETAARREVSALHAAVLAGVAAADAASAVASMTDSIARDLGLRSFGILVLEDDALVARGVHGSLGYGHGDRLAIGDGIAGRAAATGETTERGAPFPEVAVPLHVGERLVGVLHERHEPGSAGPDGRLLRTLADQVAIVVEAALLRDRQEETLRRLRDLDEMKSDFIAITSHELRTPLAAVRGFVNTLMRRIDVLSPAEIHEFLGIVDVQTARLIRLVEDLLVVTRIEAGKVQFDVERIDVPRFVERVVRGLGGGAGRVQTILRLDGFSGDAHRVERVLMNLLENALKFSLAPEPVLLSATSDRDHAVFRVSDRGVGIATEDAERIFERFHQTDAATTRRAEGAGLGLYITRKLVDAMGGRIDVDSVLGAGSTFTVRLPLARPTAPSRPSAATRAG